MDFLNPEIKQSSVKYFVFPQEIIYAHLKQATQFDFEKGDSVAFHKNIDKLLENIENKSFRKTFRIKRKRG